LLADEPALKTGILKEVTDDNITVASTIKVKEGKKNKTEIQQITIPYPNIKRAIVKISFKD
jgi:hypothetical protein